MLRFSSIPLKHTQAPNGSALVITLLIVTLVSIMAIGFSDIIRSEVSVSALHEGRNEAELLARMGVDLAKDTITAVTMDSNRFWYSQAGALIVSDPNDAREQAVVALHSGVPSTPFADAEVHWSAPAEFNMTSFFTPEGLIVPNADDGSLIPMPVRWIYVRKDGSFDTSETPVTNNTDNPLIGRFAYWTDDESTRLNLNTAWERDFSRPDLLKPPLPADPSNVSLTALSGFTEEMADKIRQAITPNGDFSDAAASLRFLNSLEEIRRLDGPSSGTEFKGALADHLFDLTTRSASPDLNIFNEPRIVLTTQLKYAPRDAAGNLLVDANGVPYFLDILADNTKEPTIDNISFSKLGKIMQKLVAQLKRDDWPITHKNASFHSKYFDNDVATAKFALDVIEYVRSAESSNTLVMPIRGRYDASTGLFGTTSVSADSLMGTSRKLFLTEAGCGRSTTRVNSGPNLGRFRVRILYEIHLPKHFGLPSVDLTNIDGKRLYFFLPAIYHMTSQQLGRFTDEEGAVIPQGRLVRLDASEIDGGNTILQAGGYIKVGFTFYLNDFPFPQNIGGRAGLVLMDETTDKYPIDPGAPRVEVAPVWDHNFAFSIQTVDENDPTFATYQISDPLLNNIIGNWVTSGTPQSWNGPVESAFIDPTSTDRQDVDADGNETDMSIRMPAPKGTPDNPAGVVYSVGELGYIHTGNQGFANTTALKSVRFRTLRLRPEGNPDEVPDWALLDLFSVPLPFHEHARNVLRPGGNSVAGRVNLNNRINPFGLGDDERPPDTDELTRLAPLKAVLLNAPKNENGDTLTSEEADTIVSHLSQHKLATDGARYGAGIGYNMAAEIAEVEGIADHDESGEFLIRSLIDQLSVKSNTYTIYSIGQVLKQSGSGNIVATAEQRLKVGVERHQEGNQVKLRQTSLEFFVP